MDAAINGSVFSHTNSSKSATRPTAVAGAFYPENPQELIKMVSALLNNAANQTEQATEESFPKAIIAPHAGYPYSGAAAAAIYIQLLPWREQIQRVVLLGPAHRVSVRALALPSVDTFSTPLNPVPINHNGINAIRHLPQVEINDATHAQEHSLEVHLPFLQMLLNPGFTIIPLVVGGASPQEVAEVLDTLWGGNETLIVISSDLSHFLSYEEAQQTDRKTCQKILSLEHNISPQQACGAKPINGLMLAAKQRNLHPNLIQYYNSGDTPTIGNKSRVVGYASFAFHDASSAFPTDRVVLGQTLLFMARRALHQHFGLKLPSQGDTVNLDLSKLKQPGATFVTLTQNGQLRGCIGSLVAHRILDHDIAENALSAAIRDHRFTPLTAKELSKTQVEVSLLSTPRQLEFSNEQEALAQIRPGIDGVIFNTAQHQSTFLPQVWEQIPNIEIFMKRLKEKAGEKANYWGDDVKLSVYQVQKWRE